MFNKKTNLSAVTNKVLPEKRQIMWQETEFIAHLFFSLCTFVTLQEGNGRTEAQAFFPTDIDIPSWVETCKSAGINGILITAKHRDGFLLWQSETTEYCLKNAPYLDGKGDIIKDLSDECRKNGMKFGFSFSLCDKNTKKTGKDLDKFILSQLEELLTNYGEIFEVKFDYEGIHIEDYDIESYVKLIRRLQPDAVISNGIDARHLGNNKVICRKEEWSVVEPVNQLQKIIKIDETKENKFRRPDGEGKMELDLGSLKRLKNANSLAWQPMFADISMRESQFYDKEEDLRTMFLHELKKYYFSVVGANGVLELGIPIDQRGKIHEEETLTLKSFGIDMAMIKSNPQSEKAEIIKNKNEITINFGEEKIVKMIELAENIETGQQIEQFSVYTLEKNKYKKAESHTVVGYKKLILPQKPMLTKSLKIVIEKSREFFDLKTIEIYTN